MRLETWRWHLPIWFCHNLIESFIATLYSYVKRLLSLNIVGRDTAAVYTIPKLRTRRPKYSSHYGVTLNMYFKHILPAAFVAEWLASWTAGCMILGSNPVAAKIFCIDFLKLCRINFAQW